jgi:hypothetical protein
MNEGDDKLKKAWREVGVEEPLASIDAAILAAAHRAVAPRRLSQRWAVPVSLAAVLVLAVGVTLRMQQEMPGIETSAPAEEATAPVTSATPAATPLPESAAPPAAKAPAPRADEGRTRAPVARNQSPPMQPQVRAEKALDAQAVEKKKAVVPGDSVAKPAAPSEPKPFADAIAPMRAAPPATVQTPVAPAPPPAPASAAAPAPRFESQMGAAAPAPQAAPVSKLQGDRAAESNRQAPAAAAGVAPSTEQARAKRDMRELATDAAKEAQKGPLERELDRIAQLRRDGRNAEADEALEKFRRENPGYRIPDAVWEQVKSR